MYARGVDGKPYLSPPPLPDPTTGPGRLVAKAQWTDRLPHEGTLSVTLLPKATQGVKRRRRLMDDTVSLTGFRRGAAYFPRAYVEAEWERLEEGIVRSPSPTRQSPSSSLILAPIS